MLISTGRLESLIVFIRGQKVMLDSDLAELYGVNTRELLQSVKRNLDRFPEDFAFVLSNQEVRNLRSQIVISSLQPLEMKDDSKVEGDQDRDRSYGGRRTNPHVFTEQGVAMLSSVLNSPRAVQVNIEIIRAFVRLRELIASNADLAARLKDLEEKYDSQFKIVFDAIRELMTPTVPPKKGKLGF